MPKFEFPETMRAWQYTECTNGIENNLSLNTVPLPIPTASQHLVQIFAASLNPVDYKPAESDLPLLARSISKPATPGIDFCGRIVIPCPTSSLKEGDIVCGAAGTSPLAGGALREFAVVREESCMLVPEGLKLEDAATVAVVGLTSYQAIVPRVKEGDRVFINGGSGGCGIFAVQFAKLMGTHVTTSCSTRNVELCKDLGADVVLDYTKLDGGILEELKKGDKFDLVVDNVGADSELIWNCHEYMKPKATYVLVAGVPSWSFTIDTIKRMVLPAFLGGLQRRVEGFFPVRNKEHVAQIVQWIAAGKVKTVIDQKFAFEDAPKAFIKLKTGRARGKIVVDVALETYKKGWSDE